MPSSGKRETFSRTLSHQKSRRIFDALTKAPAIPSLEQLDALVATNAKSLPRKVARGANIPPELIQDFMMAAEVLKEVKTLTEFRQRLGLDSESGNPEPGVTRL